MTIKTTQLPLQNPDDLPRGGITVDDFINQDELNSAQKQLPQPKRTDLSRFRKRAKKSWEEVIEGESFVEQVMDVIQKSVLLPRESFQLPIVLSYLMLPSAFCEQVPILFCNGPSGSGKSNIGYVGTRLHNSKPVSAGSTATSIRNEINKRRKWDIHAEFSEWNERHGILVWEDVDDDEVLRNDGALFAILKNGRNRSGTVMIASKDGHNLEFPVFCPVVMSSIHPILSNHNLRELKRRTIVIEHKPLSQWTHEDFDGHSKESLEGRLQKLARLDWSGFDEKFVDFWNDEITQCCWERYSDELSSIRRVPFDDMLLEISFDLIVCGCVIGAWESMDHAVESMAQYWRWHYENIEVGVSSTQKVIRNFIAERTGATAARNTEFIKMGCPEFVKAPEIPARDLKIFYENALREGLFEPGTSLKEINLAIKSEGWRLESDSSGNSKWVQ